MSRLSLVFALVGLFAASVAGAARADDSVTYAYDGFGRLYSVTYANGTTITYNNDLASNRLGQTVMCDSSGC